MGGNKYADRRFNVLLIGPPDTGRTAKAVIYAEVWARGIDRPPTDVICIHNFDQPGKHLLIELPNGRAATFRDAVAEFVRTGPININARRALLEPKIAEARNQRLEAVRLEMNAKLAPLGFGWATGENGGWAARPVSLTDPASLMSEEDEAALKPDVLSAVKAKMSEPRVRAAVSKSGHAIRLFIKQIGQEADGQRRASAIKSLAMIVVEFLEPFEDQPLIVDWLEKAAEPVIELASLLFAAQNNEGDEQLQEAAVRNKAAIERLLTVNVLADNAGVMHPRVVHASDPRYSRIFGRMRMRQVDSDTFTPDHTLTEPGYLVQASGGILILDLEELILRGGGWLAFRKLLRVLKAGRLTMENPATYADTNAQQDFKTTDLPINLKVVAVCGRDSARKLLETEHGFNELFQVVSEFDGAMPIEEAPRTYAAFVGAACRDSGLRPFAPEAVAALIEQGSRWVENQLKATAEVGLLKPSIVEADHRAGLRGSDVVEAEDVHGAFVQRFERRSLEVRQYQDKLDSGRIILQHDGQRVGAVNCLVVIGSGTPTVFGCPTRLVGRAFAGKGNVVLVDSKVGRTGPSMDKSIAEITGWLLAELASRTPLSLMVQMAFEQNNGGIEGDSASLGEALCAWSAITGLPVDQRYSLTGSMSQLGEAQVIGGAIHKIEGHFDLLKRLGHLGRTEHGVLLPRLNLRNLMLKEEVVEAHRRGRYVVRPVDHVEQVLEFMLGKPMKEQRELAKANLRRLGATKRWWQLSFAGKPKAG